MPWVFVFALSTKGQSLVFFTPLEITRLVVLNETTLPVAWCCLGLSAEAALDGAGFDGALVWAAPATVAASSNAAISRAQSLSLFIGLPPLRWAWAHHAPERPARQASRRRRSSWTGRFWSCFRVWRAPPQERARVG